MNANWKNWTSLALATALVVVVVVALCWQPALAQRDTRGRRVDLEGQGAPRYTVVETQGHNLIVTDNRSNTLYFYTIDKDAKIGSDLKLRGQVDLTQVGKKVIKPTNVHLQKD
jgi:hypothetical protein